MVGRVNSKVSLNRYTGGLRGRAWLKRFWYTFVFYGLHVVSASVVYCWIYLRSGKSVLLLIIMHGTVNGLVRIYNYENAYTGGGMVAATAVTILWILAALIIVLKSPYFNNSSGTSLEKERSIV